MSRYSKIQGSQWETCKADPDLAGACFALHGRVSAANGSPTFRIWRSGTRRFLGVSNDILPETIATHMNWDAEAFADFLVCPLTPERPGRMQMVCVESARNVIFKKR